MKKSILNLGKALNKAEQKSINGGYKTKETCDPMNGDRGFWGLHATTGRWCCTVMKVNGDILKSYC